jgi:hypothetical protein
MKQETPTSCFGWVRLSELARILTEKAVFSNPAGKIMVRERKEVE